LSHYRHCGHIHTIPWVAPSVRWTCCNSKPHCPAKLGDCQPGRRCSFPSYYRPACLVLLLRFSISQMDVPARQSYTMAVVPAEERSTAGGFTGVARTTGAAISPLLAGFLFAKPSLISLPFFIAGGLKIIYDLMLYRGFVTVQPPEEQLISQ
jgi:MFS family permease